MHRLETKKQNSELDVKMGIGRGKKQGSFSNMACQAVLIRA